MPIETLLSFDSQGAFEAFSQALEAVVKDLADTVLENARANLGGDYPEVSASLQASLTSLAQSGLIDGQIGSDHWEAWLAEWGSGSLMDRTNPDLAQYMGSELWNPVRDGFDITGRPEGPYLGLDGALHESSGKLAGISLEDLVEHDPAFREWADTHVGPGAFQPKPPLHFIRDALESNRALIIDQLNGVLETFNFGAFLV
ncbi:hypothetical protein GCM10025857_14870 [Alicyclobacillus contaminans]|uniref:hypothetical protein n=1 Tax=Alicyclobacillus contaminans TaxID=392016 RepID=UPI00040065EE|nr:hypothetical protein [Alicyclobacillus contaminans]GMA50130.1 hypothetical protein GCM10025857_14870 [Alicyclobacillus contaminans]